MSKIYLLSNKGILDDDIVHLPVFEIEKLDFTIDFSQYDALVFTSKNAVFSLKNFDPFWKEIPSYAISDKTFQVLDNLGSNVVYNAKANNGNEFATLLSPTLKGKKVLYLRAQNVVSDLENILNNSGVFCDSCVMYKTKCVDYTIDKKPPEGSVLIFSSPSSIDCFMKSFPIDESYKIVVIGETTANKLPANINYHLSKDKSLASCIEIAKKLI